MTLPGRSTCAAMILAAVTLAGTTAGALADHNNYTHTPASRDYHRYRHTPFGEGYGYRWPHRGYHRHHGWWHRHYWRHRYY